MSLSFTGPQASRLFAMKVLGGALIPHTAMPQLKLIIEDRAAFLGAWMAV
jgi:hypothetical protein